MEFIRQWIFGIAGAGIIGTVALAVAPEGSVKKILKVVVALVLIISVLRPFIGWDPAFGLEDWGGEISREGIEKTGMGLMEVIIAERTSAYIVNKAQAIGLDVSVIVECRIEEHYPIPWRITIGHPRPEHAKNALSNLIYRDIGVPPERQIYRQEEFS